MPRRAVIPPKDLSVGRPQGNYANANYFSAGDEVWYWDRDTRTWREGEIDEPCRSTLMYWVIDAEDDERKSIRVQHIYLRT